MCTERGERLQLGVNLPGLHLLLKEDDVEHQQRRRHWLRPCRRHARQRTGRGQPARQKDAQRSEVFAAGDESQARPFLLDVVGARAELHRLARVETRAVPFWARCAAGVCRVARQRDGGGQVTLAHEGLDSPSNAQGAHSARGEMAAALGEGVCQALEGAQDDKRPALNAEYFERPA